MLPSSQTVDKKHLQIIMNREVLKEKALTIMMNTGEREIIRRFLSEYDIKTVEDIQDALLRICSAEQSRK